MSEAITIQKLKEQIMSVLDGCFYQSVDLIEKYQLTIPEYISALNAIDPEDVKPRELSRLSDQDWQTLNRETRELWIVAEVAASGYPHSSDDGDFVEFVINFGEV